MFQLDKTAISVIITIVGELVVVAFFPASDNVKFAIPVILGLVYFYASNYTENLMPAEKIRRDPIEVWQECVRSWGDKFGMEDAANMNPLNVDIAMNSFGEFAYGFEDRDNHYRVVIVDGRKDIPHESILLTHIKTTGKEDLMKMLMKYSVLTKRGSVDDWIKLGQKLGMNIPMAGSTGANNAKSPTGNLPPM